VDVSTDVFRAGSGDGLDNPVAIPSLRGVRFTGPYGHDGRIASLAEFSQGVVTTEFGGEPLDTRELSALVRYLQDLDFLPNEKLDEHNRLTGAAAEAAHRGEGIFNRSYPGFGGGSCATCHDPSSFFRDGKAHRMGTGDPPSPHAIEDGEETPTLLNTAETAPYFHDNRFATLGDVITWFDATYALHLSSTERDDLTAYVQAVGAVDRPKDDRPLARKLNQQFAYIALASDQDPRVRRAAIEEVLVSLAGEPAALHDRGDELRASLQALRVEVSKTAIEPRAARAMRDDLSRFAADWAGALRP
jgi:cytochrome c peroxidase